MRVLVTGGVRSGKSAHAESLLASDESVTYLATSATHADDADWLARVAAHRARRPASWHTVETVDLAGGVRSVRPGDALLLDSLGTWLAAWVDDRNGWDAAAASLRGPLLDDVEAA
ncbi:bifunctional adenosylcobinamide kinase/adenosylcobinamide-phosphate guanylyltransferase, partial [Nostocoides japonicum]|uniref:bifunctional adenosylcobinamide kinase/adenosylcobinamide-phosphate guanylyltransferase n=1 Tax=Nostocoides japonicum TaxID=99481 RepID=UPI001F3D411D